MTDRALGGAEQAGEEGFQGDEDPRDADNVGLFGVGRRKRHVAETAGWSEADPGLPNGIVTANFLVFAVSYGAACTVVMVVHLHQVIENGNFEDCYNSITPQTFDILITNSD